MPCVVEVSVIDYEIYDILADQNEENEFDTQF